MAIRFRSRIRRKPGHWSEERYEKHLKDNNLFRNRKELERSLSAGVKE